MHQRPGKRRLAGGSAASETATTRPKFVSKIPRALAQCQLCYATGPLPSVRSRFTAALISARCVNACGKLPSASPEAPICSA
jgi:hypothetical protein